MADVVVDASALSAAASHVCAALPALAWDLRELDAGTLGDAEVADAISHVTAQRKARVAALAEIADITATYPIQVAAGFGQLEDHIVRSLQ